jgi:hypothetical protein
LAVKHIRVAVAVPMTASIAVLVVRPPALVVILIIFIVLVREEVEGILVFLPSL